MVKPLELFAVLDTTQLKRTMLLLQHTLLSLGGKVKDGHISLLINAGLFVSKLESSVIFLMLFFFAFYD